MDGTVNIPRWTVKDGKYHERFLVDNAFAFKELANTSHELDLIKAGISVCDDVTVNNAGR